MSHFILLSVQKCTVFLCVFVSFSCVSLYFDREMSQDQNAGRSHHTKIVNSFLERVEEFKYLVTTITNKNCIQKESKSRLKSGNACCHVVEYLLSSSVLSKNLKIKIYRTIILPVVLYGCETWSLTLWEECMLRVFEYRVVRRVFGP